jgi:hypothetical protein
VRVEAGRLGNREQTALRSRPSEGGSVYAEDEGFELLAFVLPLSDGPGGLFALDRPPETAGISELLAKKEQARQALWGSCDPNRRKRLGIADIDCASAPLARLFRT